MEKFTKFSYFIFSYFFIFLVILFSNFSYFILLSLISCLIFFIVDYFSKEKGIIYYSFAILVFSLMVIAGLKVDLVVNKTFDVYFFSNLILLLMMLVFGLITDKFKPNLTIGVRTRYSLMYPEIWEKSNLLFAKITIASVIPLGMLTFYVGGSGAFLLSFLLLMLVVLIVLIYDDYIGRRHHKQVLKDEDKNLQDSHKLNL